MKHGENLNNAQNSQINEQSHFEQSFRSPFEQQNSPYSNNDRANERFIDQMYNMDFKESLAIVSSVTDQLSPRDQELFRAELKDGQLTFPALQAFGSGEAQSTADDQGQDKAIHSVENMTKWLSENFDKLDLDGNDSLSKSELDRALFDKSTSSDGVLYLSILNDQAREWAGFFAALPTTAKQEIHRSTIGVAKFYLGDHNSETTQDQLNIHHIGSFLREISGDDNALTRGELDEALVNDNLSPEQRKALGILKQHFQEVAETTIDVDFDNPVPPPAVSEEFVSDVDLKMFAAPEQKFIERLESFIKSREKHQDMKDDSVEQQDLGSCFLLGPLESIRKIDAEAIDRMIKDNGDGTVTVTFPGDPDRPQRIEKLSEAEKTEFAGGKAGTVEKAFAQ